LTDKDGIGRNRWRVPGIEKMMQLRLIGDSVGWVDEIEADLRYVAQ
jgi:hypothetical protein